MQTQTRNQNQENKDREATQQLLAEAGRLAAASAKQTEELKKTNNNNANVRLSSEPPQPPSVIPPVTIAKRWSYAAITSVVPRLVLDGLSFWAPATAQVVNNLLPSYVQIGLPVACALVGFLPLPHVEALVRGAIQKCKGATPYRSNNQANEESRYILLATPHPDEIDREGNYKKAGVAFAETIFYTALNLIKTYSAREISEAIFAELPPVATPLLVAAVGYGVGKLCYETVTQSNVKKSF